MDSGARAGCTDPQSSPTTAAGSKDPATLNMDERDLLGLTTNIHPAEVRVCLL